MNYDPYVIARGQEYSFNSRDAALLFAQAFRAEMKSRDDVVLPDSPEGALRDSHVELNPSTAHDIERLWY